MNGGDFAWSKGWHTPIHERCALGVIVCNGSTFSANPPLQPVFAMTSSCDIYVGDFPYSLFGSVSVVNAVSGQAVLVLNGTAQHRNFSASHRDMTLTPPPSSFRSLSSFKNAPRTALGHDVNGRILTLQVDGDESENTGTASSWHFRLFLLRPCCSHSIGATLAEMADLMVAAGAWSAIELDGGGSSTTVIIRPPLKSHV